MIFSLTFNLSCGSHLCIDLYHNSRGSCLTDKLGEVEVRKSRLTKDSRSKFVPAYIHLHTCTVLIAAKSKFVPAYIHLHTCTVLIAAKQIFGFCPCVTCQVPYFCNCNVESRNRTSSTVLLCSHVISYDKEFTNKFQLVGSCKYLSSSETCYGL